jgi:hypothetical protein
MRKRHYCLGAVSPFHYPQGAIVPRKAAIREVLPLGPAELSGFQEAVREVHDFDKAQRLYIIFERNVATLGAFLAHVLESHVLSALDTHAALRGHLIEVDRLLLNILTSMRTFTDHAETHLKRKFGSSSAEPGRFKEACSREYDRHFCYRFMYQFRNYSQHCGLPAGSIAFTSRSTRLGRIRNETAGDSLSNGPHVVGITFNRENLVSSFDGWKIVANQLEAARDRSDKSDRWCSSVDAQAPPRASEIVGAGP